MKTNVTLIAITIMVAVGLLHRINNRKITDLEVRINKLQTQLNVHQLHE